MTIRKFLDYAFLTYSLATVIGLIVFIVRTFN